MNPKFPTPFDIRWLEAGLVFSGMVRMRIMLLIQSLTPALRISFPWGCTTYLGSVINSDWGHICFWGMANPISYNFFRRLYHLLPFHNAFIASFIIKAVVHCLEFSFLPQFEWSDLWWLCSILASYRCHFTGGCGLLDFGPDWDLFLKSYVVVLIPIQCPNRFLLAYCIWSAKVFI